MVAVRHLEESWLPTPIDRRPEIPSHKQNSNWATYVQWATMMVMLPRPRRFHRIVSVEYAVALVLLVVAFRVLVATSTTRPEVDRRTRYRLLDVLLTTDSNELVTEMMQNPGMTVAVGIHPISPL